MEPASVSGDLDDLDMEIEQEEQKFEAMQSFQHEEGFEEDEPAVTAHGWPS